jgi:hypothetical protein
MPTVSSVEGGYKAFVSHAFPAVVQGTLRKALEISSGNDGLDMCVYADALTLEAACKTLFYGTDQSWQNRSRPRWEVTWQPKTLPGISVSWKPKICNINLGMVLVLHPSHTVTQYSPVGVMVCCEWEKV